MRTVRETATFSADARVLLTAQEYDRLIEQLASDPLSGDLIPGTGGVRKLRVSVSGRGKRGGARVIYFYFSDDRPVDALAIFAKGEKSDLTAREHNELKKLTDAVKADWRRRSGKVPWQV